MAGRIRKESTYYTEADEALGRVKPRPERLATIRDSVTVCVACKKPPAPLGYGNQLAYADWLRDRDREVPDSARRNRKALRMAEDDCPGCMSQLTLVIGIPDNLLSYILCEANEAKLAHIKSFLAANFVFPICDRCRGSESERVRVSAAEIERRYRYVLKVLHGHSRPQDGTAQTEAEVFRLLGEAVRQRNVA